MKRRRLISAVCAFALTGLVTAAVGEYTNTPQGWWAQLNTSGSGQCLINNGATPPTFQTCPGLVTSVFGRIGAVVAQAADYAAFYLKLPGYTTSILYCADSPYNVAAANSRAANDTGIQACITDAKAGGYVAQLPSGVLLTSAHFTCNGNGPLRMVGTMNANVGVGVGTTIGTTVSSNLAAGDVFSCVTWDSVQFEHFTIENTGGSSGRLIYIAAFDLSVTSCNYSSRIANMRLNGGGTAIALDAACAFNVYNNTTLNQTISCIVASTATSVLKDQGDSSIYGNRCWDFAQAATGPAISIKPASGIMLTMNKTLGFQYGLYIESTGTAGTVIALANSLEEFAVTGIRVVQASAGSLFGYVDASHNEIQSFRTSVQGAISVVGGAARYVYKAIFAYNIIALHGSTFGAPTCIGFGDGEDITADQNNCTIDGNANPAVTYSTSGNAIRPKIIHGRDAGFVTRYSLNVSTLIEDNVGVAFAGIPAANVANGSRLFISDADPASGPCTSAGAKTGSTAFRQNAAWKCF